MVNGDSRVNIYGTNEKCRNCFWQEDCKKFMKQILSNPKEDINIVKNELDEIEQCKFFLHNEYDSSVYGLSDMELEQDTEINREEFINDWNLYVGGWN